MKKWIVTAALLFVVGCTGTVEVGDKIKDPVTGEMRAATPEDVIENLNKQIEELELAQDATDSTVPWTGPAAGVGVVLSGFLGTRLNRLKKERELLLASLKANKIKVPDGVSL